MMLKGQNETRALFMVQISFQINRVTDENIGITSTNIYIKTQL